MNLPKGTLVVNDKVINAKGFVEFCKEHYNKTFEFFFVEKQVSSAMYKMDAEEENVIKKQTYRLSLTDLQYAAQMYLNTLGIDVKSSTINFVTKVEHIPGDSFEPLDYGSDIVTLYEITF